MRDATAEEFERGYAERSAITVERLRELGRVVRPCDCGEDECRGWQSVSEERAAEYDEQRGDYYGPGEQLAGGVIPTLLREGSIEIDAFVWRMEGDTERQGYRDAHGKYRRDLTVARWVRLKLDRAKREGWKLTHDPVIDYSDNAPGLWERNRFAYQLTVKVVRYR